MRAVSWVSVWVSLVALPGCCFGGSEAETLLQPLGVTRSVEPAVRDDVPAALDGASLSMGSMTVNGQELAAISCTGEIDLFGTNPIGALADQGSAAATCTGGSARPRVHFAFAGGAVSDVRVAEAGSPEAARCIADLVSSMRPAGTGACVATLVLRGR
jgi:hypothetical protein